MRVLKYIPFLLIVALSSAANAGTDVTVKGKITPPGCAASFVGGADLDWGDTPWASLKSTGMTTLPAKKVTLQVQCSGGAKVGMAFWVDEDINKANAQTGPNTGENNKDHNDPTRIFGIGTDPVTQQKIGNFTMISLSSSHDSTVQDKWLSFAPSTSHTETPTSWDYMGVAMKQGEDWAVYDSTTNKAAIATTHTFTFNVEPQLNDRSKLTATQEIPFAGVAKFNIRYF